MLLCNQCNDIVLILKQRKVLNYISESMSSNPRKLYTIEKPSLSQRPMCRSQSPKGRSKNATLTIFVMALSFYICWTPYAIRCLLGMVGVDLNFRLSGASILFSKLGVIVNPIIYIFHNNEVSRKMFIRS